MPRLFGKSSRRGSDIPIKPSSLSTLYISIKSLLRSSVFWDMLAREKNSAALSNFLDGKGIEYALKYKKYVFLSPKNLSVFRSLSVFLGKLNTIKICIAILYGSLNREPSIT